MMTTTSNSRKTTSEVLYFTSSTNHFYSNPSPLSLTYHSTSTRQGYLSTLLPTTTSTCSTTKGRGPSTVTEIDSAYCPQCLTSWDANSAFNSAKGICFKTTTTIKGRSTRSSDTDGDNDDDDMMRIGCVNCPICESILALSVQEAQLYRMKLTKDENNVEASEGDSSNCTHVCLYRCGYCHWNSLDDLGVYSKISFVSSSMSSAEISEKEMTERAAMEVQLQLSRRMDKRKQCAAPLITDLVTKWNAKLKSEEMDRRKTELLVSRPGADNTTSKAVSIANTCSVLNSKDLNLRKASTAATVVTTTTTTSWSIDSLNEFMTQKKNHVLRQVNNSLLKVEEGSEDEEREKEMFQKTTLSDLPLSGMSRTVIQGATATDIIIPMATSMQSSNQLIISSSNSPLHDEKALMPIPVKLRTRSVRRDCRELALGKPGILVKPKVNPLDGDSSLRNGIGQGQWWKKDSSAIHTMPKLTIWKQSYNKETAQHALLIQISNPKLEPITFKIHTNFSSMKYVSEDDDVITTATNDISFPSTYDNLVLNSFPLEVVQSRVISKTAATTKTTMKTVSLDPKDSFLEFGTNSDASRSNKANLKKILQNWETTIDWSNISDKEKEESCDCKFIFQHNDTAYVQYLVRDEENDNNQNQQHEEFISTPLVLEVGDGSWELKEDKGQTEDFVSFVVLPTWRLN